MNTEKIFLLTGAGGFIGRFVLKNYFKRNDVKIYLLENGDFAQKLNQYLDSQNLTPAQREKYIVFQGDITQKNLGCSPELYKKIQSEVNYCLHLAAIYNLSVAKEIAWKINVEGTTNILELLKSAPHLKKLGFVSTTAIVGYFSGNFNENDFDMNQKFKNHYDETKFESEKLVRAVWDKIPSVIFRPGYVVGDTQKGEIDKIDGPYYAMTMIKRKLHIAIPNSPHVKIHLAPVNFVADAMYSLLEDENAVKTAYHLTDPNPLTYNDFFKYACQAMGTFQPLFKIAPKIFKPLMRFKILQKIIGVPYEAFAYVDHPITYDTSNTQKALLPYGVKCPPLTSYLKILTGYFLNR